MIKVYKHTRLKDIISDPKIIGYLTSCTSAEVTEELGGAYTAEITCLTSDPVISDLTAGMCISLPANPQDGDQIFRVSEIVTDPVSHTVGITAEHISYDLSKVILLPTITAQSAASAMSMINSGTHTVGFNDFVFSTDLGTVAKFSPSAPGTLRSWMGGREGSLLDVYRGTWHFDNNRAIFMKQRGADKGVAIRYGTHITSLLSTQDASGLYDGVMCFYDSDGECVYGYPAYVSGVTGRKIKLVDCTSDYDDTTPTVADLTAAAVKYASDNADMAQITCSMSVDVSAAAENGAGALQDVALGDTVRIIYPGTTASTRVVTTVYDAILERYTSVELGKPTASLAQVITSATSDASDPAPTRSDLDAAIAKATAMLTGASGGHYVIGYSDGHPSEIYMMDTDDVATAKKVTRINYEGIGGSVSGIAGPYVVSMTLDGGIVADRITSGTINSIRMTAPDIVFGDENGVEATSGDMEFSVTGGKATGTGTLFSGAGSVLFDLGEYLSAYAEKGVEMASEGAVRLSHKASADATDPSSLVSVSDKSLILKTGDGGQYEASIVQSVLPSGPMMVLTASDSSGTVTSRIQVKGSGISITASSIILDAQSMDVSLGGVRYNDLEWVDDGNGHAVLGKS